MREQEDRCTSYDCLGILEWVYFRNLSNSYLAIKRLDHNTNTWIFSPTKGLWDSILSFMHLPGSKNNVLNIHLLPRNYYLEPNKKYKTLCECNIRFQVQACWVIPFSCVSVTAAPCLRYDIWSLHSHQERESVFESVLIEWHKDAIGGNIGDSNKFLSMIQSGHCNVFLNSHFTVADKLTSTMKISSFLSWTGSKVGGIRKGNILFWGSMGSQSCNWGKI